MTAAALASMEVDPDSLEKYRLKLRCKVCYHLGPFCPDVDDVVQTTLTRCLMALRDHKIHKIESLGAFLSGVCNNVILEYRRRIWREPLGEPAEDSQLVSPDAEQFELRDLISDALAQMSQRDCEILRAFYLQERNKDEICRTMGLTDGQFRVALFRAKERFRKIYREGLKRSAPGPH